MNGYITAKELAKRIGVDPSAIRSRIKRDTIKGAIKIGGERRGEWYIPIAEADKVTRSAAGKPPKN